MASIILERFAYLEDKTLGELKVEGITLNTVEKPWVPTAAHLGGFPYQSCVPDGYYNVTPFVRPSGDKVWQLENPELGVYKTEDEVPMGDGRFLILIHAGNTVDDVVGCIAPGTTGTLDGVWNSREAMAQLYEVLGHKRSHTLRIRPRGTHQVR